MPEHVRRALTEFPAFDGQGRPVTVPAGSVLTRCDWWSGEHAGAVWEFVWNEQRLRCDGVVFEGATRQSESRPR